MEGTNDAFLRIDPEGIIFDANKNVSSLFGKNPDELIGLHIVALDIIKCNSNEKIDSNNQLEITSSSETVRVANDEEKFCEINTWPEDLRSGKIYNVIMQDVTNQRKMVLSLMKGDKSRK